MSAIQLRLPGRPVGHLPQELGLLVVGVPLAVLVGVVGALHPEWWRGLLATGLLINLMVVAMKWPGAAAVATLLWLPFLAFVRRLLLEEAGWTQNDPLILVGPLAAVFIVYRVYVLEKRPLAPDRISKLVLVLLVFAFFGAFNPLGGGAVLGGLAGLIYLGVPLLWFFIGREVADRRTVRGLMYAVVVLSCGIAAYGLYQTEFGSLPQWDIDWYFEAGFAGVRAATSEGGELLFRPWGTFASTSEYSGYLAMALIFAAAMVFHRRPVLIAVIPLLALAVFLAGGRSVMALTLLTGVLLTALRSRNGVAAIAIVVLGIGVTYGVALTIGERLDRAAGLSGSATTSRQVGGLLNPLDPSKSTFLTHWDSLWRAVGDGFTNPVGHGTGASNIGGRLGGGGRETDIDIGDVFVSFGFVGGFVFLAIIVLSFREVFRRYLRGRPDGLIFAVIGIMIVNFGQWLQGGHYAASALMWFLLGWAVRPRRPAASVDEESSAGSVLSEPAPAAPSAANRSAGATVAPARSRGAAPAR